MQLHIIQIKLIFAVYIRYLIACAQTKVYRLNDFKLEELGFFFFFSKQLNLDVSRLRISDHLEAITSTIKKQVLPCKVLNSPRTELSNISVAINNNHLYRQFCSHSSNLLVLNLEPKSFSQIHLWKNC